MSNFKIYNVSGRLNDIIQVASHTVIINHIALIAGDNDECVIHLSNGALIKVNKGKGTVIKEIIEILDV